MVLLLYELNLETRGKHDLFTAPIFPANIWIYLIPTQLDFKLFLLIVGLVTQM